MLHLISVTQTLTGTMLLSYETVHILSSVMYMFRYHVNYVRRSIEYRYNRLNNV